MPSYVSLLKAIWEASEDGRITHETCTQAMTLHRRLYDAVPGLPAAAPSLGVAGHAAFVWEHGTVRMSLAFRDGETPHWQYRNTWTGDVGTGWWVGEEPPVKLASLLRELAAGLDRIEQTLEENSQ